ncbi:MAG TPA: YdcF family protein [Puia sp.]|nr:YdcF family protein [Puia sp.]
MEKVGKQPAQYICEMINREILIQARKLWDYHHLYHIPAPSDCILVLGSLDLRVANRGAELYLQGLAPYMVFSGGLGNITKRMWKDPEAELFARIALDLGVPAEAIFTEDRSTNTGENILFTQRLLEEKGLHPHKFLLVQKPYMERRSFATFKKHWPDKELLVTSPQIGFENYATPEMPIEQVIDLMVGDLQRIKVYPEKGFQIPQDIPDEVWAAYEKLVGWGFTRHLIS